MASTPRTVALPRKTPAGIQQAVVEVERLAVHEGVRVVHGQDVSGYRNHGVQRVTAVRLEKGIHAAGDHLGLLAGQEGGVILNGLFVGVRGVLGQGGPLGRVNEGHAGNRAGDYLGTGPLRERAAVEVGDCEIAPLERL